MRRRFQVRDARLLRLEYCALEKGRQEAAAPIVGSVHSQSGRIGEYNIRRQFLRFASKAVNHPRSDRRASGNARLTALKITDAGLVAIDACVHRANYAD